MIYFFNNYQSLPLERYRELLPPERADRFERLRQERDRENCLAAYLLLQYALRQCGIDSFGLKTGENGKPFLENEALYFNLSHCKLGASLAVSEHEVGIDIQDIQPYDRRIIERVGTEAEIELIESSADRDKAFTRIWTLKEAAAKCDGRGISVLNNFEFDTDRIAFEKYGKKFTTFEIENLLISVCGEEAFSDIIEIKDLEVFL